MCQPPERTGPLFAPSTWIPQRVQAGQSMADRQECDQADCEDGGDVAAE